MIFNKIVQCIPLYCATQYLFLWSHTHMVFWSTRQWSGFSFRVHFCQLQWFSQKHRQRPSEQSKVPLGHPARGSDGIKAVVGSFIPKGSMHILTMTLHNELLSLFYRTKINIKLPVLSSLVPSGLPFSVSFIIVGDAIIR